MPALRVLQMAGAAGPEDQEEDADQDEAEAEADP